MSLVPADTSSNSSLLALVPKQVPEIYGWAADLQPVIDAPAGGGRRGRALAAIAARRGVSPITVRKKFDSYRKYGVTGLIDRKRCVSLWDSRTPIGMSAADQELVKTWVECYQRKKQPAIRALLLAWRSQAVSREQMERGLAVPQTDTPLDPMTGYPIGWSDRNLDRKAPTKYELKATRIGRAAAKSEMPLVYTTRAGLYVGQFYLWDDMWHDHEVVDLDQRKRGRPLEFHGLDLKSANKFVWGSRTRIESEFKHEGLKAADFRFVLAAGLTGTGYHPTLGTTLIVEHGTAAIPPEIEALLFDATGGMIRVARGGMEGAAAHAGQYAGRSKGNFRFKAGLESLGNLIHNEMSYLPGQVGMDRDHCPEEMHDGGRLVDPRTGQALTAYGRQKHTDALLAAFEQLPPERAQWLQWPVCTVQQFRLICDEIYSRINRRTEHDLEGWDELYVPDQARGGMRRMMPHEVMTAGKRALRPIDDALVALLIGSESGTEHTVRSNMIEVRCGEISGDILRYDATGRLPDREKYLTVVNPLDAGRLFCYDAQGRFVAVLPRLHAVCRADVEAMQLACGEAAKREAMLLAPIRRRHLAEARVKAARHATNGDVIAGRTVAEEQAAARERARAVRFGQAVKDADGGNRIPESGESGESAPAGIVEVWPDAPTDFPTNEPAAEPEVW